MTGGEAPGATGGILERICATTARDVAARRQRRPFDLAVRAARAAPAPRGFMNHLRATRDAGRHAVIAEIKKASPSQGCIRADFDPAALARAYAGAGATCLSILTDGPFFEGTPEHLIAARAAVPLPVLRKDFMLEPYQIVESRAMGADCVLLILAALDDATATALAQEAKAWGVDVLAEVHDAAELDRALRLDAPMIGINNRNLKTLRVDLATTEKLAPHVPGDRLLVCESGLATPADLARMTRAGAGAFLVGTALMREPDVGAALARLIAPVAPAPV